MQGPRDAEPVPGRHADSPEPPRCLKHTSPDCGRTFLVVDPESGTNRTAARLLWMRALVLVDQSVELLLRYSWPWD
ncbi:hypothetical protein GN956_G13827 [Arapaima gigas]